jgi:hypothetical protein
VTVLSVLNAFDCDVTSQDIRPDPLLGFYEHLKKLKMEQKPTANGLQWFTELYDLA